MNLIVRITLLFVAVSLVVFIIGGVISYNVMMREVDFEQRRFLVERLERAEGLVERRQPTDTIRWSKLMIVPLAELEEEQRVFSDTIVMHAQLDRLEPHLKLDAVKNVAGRSYLISLYDIVIEPDDIQDGLQESLVTIYLILLSAVLIIGLLASYFILRPFNRTLSVIKQFSLTDTQSIAEFPTSRVKEFKRLNQFLTEMTNKVSSDYQSLKEFSENASHELQTPIAVVQAKLEVLLDADNLNEQQVAQITSAQGALKRLSSLSNSLSLITRIENQEFDNVSEISLQEVLGRLLQEFQELAELKSLTLEVSLQEDVLLKADRVLIELMLTNILNNAIRHNWENGKIKVCLEGKTLKVANTGAKLGVDPSELFLRFKKSNQSAQSLGLGLAIVKKICDRYGYLVNYTNDHDLHTIEITF